MKTKLTFLMTLALASSSIQNIRAEEVLMDLDGDGFAEVVNLDQLDEASFKPGAPSAPKLCGGADDDQLTAATKLCGGMDDDQIVGGGDADSVKPPVLQGLVTDPLGVVAGQPANFYPGIQGPYPMQTNGFLTPVQYPYTLVPGGASFTNSAGAIPPSMIGATVMPQTLITDGASFYADSTGAFPLMSGTVGSFLPPVNRGITSDPLGICGGNGNDSIITGAGAGGGPNVSVTDALILRLMTTGSLTGDSMDDDDLWGGGGTDEVVIVNPSGGSI